MTETQTIDSVCSDQRKRVYELREILFLNEEKNTQTSTNIYLSSALMILYTYGFRAVSRYMSVDIQTPS
jgi:hypothetical protein